MFVRAYIIYYLLPITQDVVEVSGKRQYLQSGLSKSFSWDLIPQDAVIISAWSYDSNIGRAYKLTVEHQIER